MGIVSYRKALTEKQALRKVLENRRNSTQEEIDREEEKSANIDTALALIQKAVSSVQQQLEFHISNTVTLALDAVFPDPYEFKMEFVMKRNNSECELWFIKNGEKIKPIDASGGGVVDVASFALRCAYWSLSNTRNTIILDEPFKFCSASLQPEVGKMMKTISTKLGLQFIMISHLQELIDASDRVFKVKQIKGKSQVHQV